MEKEKLTFLFGLDDGYRGIDGRGVHTGDKCSRAAEMTDKVRRAAVKTALDERRRKGF